MGQTYEQHKAAVDAANPTPLMTWYQTTGHDNPLHSDDDREVAVGALTWMGTTQSFRAFFSIRGNMVSTWGIRPIGPTDEHYNIPRNSQATTWTGCKAEFATVWESYCEEDRVRQAVENVAHDIIADDRHTALPRFPRRHRRDREPGGADAAQRDAHSLDPGAGVRCGHAEPTHSTPPTTPSSRSPSSAT